mmetsp:Transcript_4352/g.10107  ORF Transcript_4352/g.10107 Transcript_4352/m.10107 type:complete len:277 (+) Transcript_4352:265-1095(+)
MDKIDPVHACSFLTHWTPNLPKAALSQGSHDLWKLGVDGNASVTVFVHLLLPFEDQNTSLDQGFVQGVVALRHQRFVDLLGRLQVVVGEEERKVKESEETHRSPIGPALHRLRRALRHHAHAALAAVLAEVGVHEAEVFVGLGLLIPEDDLSWQAQLLCKLLGALTRANAHHKQLDIGLLSFREPIPFQLDSQLPACHSAEVAQKCHYNLLVFGPQAGQGHLCPIRSTAQRRLHQRLEILAALSHRHWHFLGGHSLARHGPGEPRHRPNEGENTKA